MTIRVLIADDQVMVRQRFTVLLDAEPGIEVVGQAVDGVDAIEKAGELAPGVVLMDIRMPRLGGIDATRRLTEAPAAQVKVLCTRTRRGWCARPATDPLPGSRTRRRPGPSCGGRRRCAGPCGS